MKVFKQLVRSVLFVGFVGGWTVAASTLYVVRTPNSKFPAFVTKDHPSLDKDTYMDTRNWTLHDDAAHPEFVRRVIEVGRADLLAHTVGSTSVPVGSQLAAAVNGSVAAVK